MLQIGTAGGWANRVGGVDGQVRESRLDGALRADHDLLDDFELVVDDDRDAAFDDAEMLLDGDREWQALRALWLTLPEPELDAAGAERILQGVMRAIERRNRWRRLGTIGVALMVPVALIGALRLARAHG